MANIQEGLKIKPKPASPFPRVIDTLLQNVEGNLFVIGNDLRPIWSSDPERRLLGVPASEWGSGTLINVVHPDDREWVKRKRHELLSTPGATIRGQIRICPPGEDVSTVLFTAANRFDDPEINGLVMTTRTLTDVPTATARTADPWSQQAELMTHLSQGIRSSVATITAALDDLSGSADPVTQSRSATIATATEALDALLVDVTDLASISTGSIELASEVFSPRALVDDLINTFGPMCTAKDIELRSTVDAGLPPSVRGDARRLHQVLHQLLSNAVRATADGSVHLETWIDDGGRIGFRVSDTGSGLEESSASNMFDPVVAGRLARDQRGFGLAIAKQLIELMDGALGYETSARGTSFWFDLMFGHARRIEDQPLTTSTAPLEADDDVKKVLHVLVVDDSDVNRLLAASQLERLGHRYEQASGGVEALKKLQEDSFDVVLMDWHMPGLNGLETTRRWRADHDPDHALPIITMTASAMAGDRERCLQAGASDYLSKPVSINDLDSMLARWSSSDDHDVHADSAAPDQSTIDMLIADLGSVSVVKSVVDTFIELVPQHRSAAARAHAHGDTTTLHRSAHTLKSTAQMLGIEDLAEACLQVECATIEAATTLDDDVDHFLRCCDSAIPGLTELAGQLARAAEPQ